MQLNMHYEIAVRHFIAVWLQRDAESSQSTCSDTHGGAWGCRAV